MSEHQHGSAPAASGCLQCLLVSIGVDPEAARRLHAAYVNRSAAAVERLSLLNAHTATLPEVTADRLESALHTANFHVYDVIRAFAAVGEALDQATMAIEAAERAKASKSAPTN